MSQQRFKKLKLGTYEKTVLVVDPGHGHHAHCPMCEACMTATQATRFHRCPGDPRKKRDPLCPGDGTDPFWRTMNAFWMKPSEEMPRGHKTEKPKQKYNGIPLAKVLKFADKRYYRPLNKKEAEAVRQYFEEHKLSNSDLSERRGEPPRPTISVVEEISEARVWSLNPVTGTRTLSTTRTITRKEKRMRTVTHHAQALAVRGGESFGGKTEPDENGTEYDLPTEAPIGYWKRS
jgi:hypothetical protein